MDIQTLVRAASIMVSGDWIGWMFAIAIIIGGVLDNRGRDLIGWCVSVIVFAIFNLAVSITYMSKVAVLAGRNPVLISTETVVFVLITLIVYCTGLAIGWFTVWSTKHRSRLHYITKHLRESNEIGDETP